MERSEPTLVPQWLRNTGSVTGAGNSAHHFASPSLSASSSHSDLSLAPHSRSRSSKSIGDFDSPRSAFLDRSSSSNSRRNTSNGSAKHAYSSFNRSHRDKDREKERDRYVDPWDRDYIDPLGSLFNRTEKDSLRRSQSLVSRKIGDPLSKRGGSVNLKNSGSSNLSNNGNGSVSGVVKSSIQKAVFEKDFPSLGTEERPDIARVPSPGFTTAVQSLPLNSSLVGGEGWTSALAEVPTVMGSTSSGSVSVQQSVVSTLGSTAPMVMAGLNMAEALQQAPLRTRAAPQLSVNTQRLEELAIKQSRQLVPMIKTSTLGSEKSKPKPGPRIGELNLTAKNGPQQTPLQHASQYLRSGSVKSETPKASSSSSTSSSSSSSHGKYLVLKPVWENGVTPSKDVTSPTHRPTSIQIAVAPPVVSAPTRSPNGQKVSVLERKVSSLDLKSAPGLEKRPSLSQVQSRNDFFNLIKKKTSGNPSTAIPDSPARTVSSPTSEKSGAEALSAPTSPHAAQNGASANGNGEIGEGKCKGDKNTEDEEEETQFLLSLGWKQENGTAEDEGLTEEEIAAFFEEVMKSKTSLSIQPKLLKLSESRAIKTDGASSESSSSDSGSDAC